MTEEIKTVEGGVAVLDRPNEVVNPEIPALPTTPDTHDVLSHATVTSRAEDTLPNLPLTERLEAIRTAITDLANQGKSGSKAARDLAREFDAINKQHIKATLDKKYGEKIAQAPPIKGGMYYMQKLVEFAWKRFSREDPTNIGQPSRKEWQKKSQPASPQLPSEQAQQGLTQP